MATATLEKPAEHTADSKRPPPGKKPLGSDRLKKTGAEWIHWNVTVSDKDEYEDAFKGWYWSNLIPSLHVGDIIEIQDDFKNLYAQVWVRAWDLHSGTVVIEELFRKEFPAIKFEQTMKSGFTVEYRGSRLLNVVIRADGKVMKTGFPTPADAYRYINNDLTPTNL